MRFTLMLLAAMGLLVGCHTSAVDRHLGEAYREDVARMVADPVASKEIAAVEGLEGTTTEGVIKSYHENQKTESQRDRQQDSGILKVR
jgi:hypothetical protein